MHLAILHPPLFLVGQDDMRHTLLPRSTGLHYCLRSLSPQIPGLHLLDVTIAYEGKFNKSSPLIFETTSLT
jgi:hypothetical protein